MVDRRDGRPLVRIANQILNRPVAISEAWAAVIISAIRSELNVDLIQTTEGVQINSWGMDQIAAQARHEVDRRKAARAGGASRALRDEPPSNKIFEEQAGVAIIEISGTLTKNWGLDSYSGFTGYDGIKTKFVAAMEDDDIDAILLDIDSPGGAVAGCFDTVDLMHAYRLDNRKPVWAIANEQACSAAYAFLTVAEPGGRFAPRTGEVGSIGVLLLHADVQKAMAMEGVKVTIFRAGKWKAEGNAYEDIAKETAERIQETLDDMRELFIDTVARNLSADGAKKDEIEALKKIVRDTEALTYIGAHARDIGLVDTIASEDQVWARLMERIGR